MKQIQTFFIAHLVVAVAALSIAFALGGLPEAILVIMLIGVLWLFANLRNIRGLEFLLLLLFTIAAASLSWLNAPSWAPMVAVIAALGAWDLDHFLQRLKIAAHKGADPRLGVQHLRRLGMVEGCGLLLGLAALITRFQIGFWGGVGLALLIAFGLSRLIVYIKREMS